MKKIKNLKKRLGLISASALMLLGGTAVSNHIHANADSNTATPNVVKIQKEIPNANSKLERTHKQQTIISQQSNSNQSKEVAQQVNELRNHIIQHVLNSHNANQNSFVNQTPQKQYNVTPSNRQRDVVIIKQTPQGVDNNQQNIPNNAPAPVRHEYKNNSKIINPKFKKDAQGLLDDLKIVANSPVDVKDTNLDSEMNTNRSKSNPDSSNDIGSNK